jgi:hypothetical protein
MPLLTLRVSMGNLFGNLLDPPGKAAKLNCQFSGGGMPRLWRSCRALLMSDQWLCLIDGQKIGPVKFTRLQQLAEAGRLKAEDYVRSVEEEQWLIAKNVPNLKLLAPVAPERVETNSKRRNSGPLPVAQPVADEGTVTLPQPATVVIPKGKTPPPVGRAIGSAPPPPVRSEAPLFVTEPKHEGSESSSSSHLHGRKKKSNSMPLLIGGVAVVGVLGLVLVLVLSGAFNPAPETDTVATKEPVKKSPAPIVNEENPDEEANPEAAEEPTNVDSKKATKPAGKSSGKSPLLASVKQFLDITKRYKPSKLPVQIAVTGMWLSSSEAGEPYVAKEDGSDEKAKDPKYLVIKVKVENAPGAAPIDYQGWGDEAMLFDEKDNPIAPLPPGKADRIVKQKIEAGGSLVDTLVFSLSDVEFETLRLALPHATVGIKDDKSFGLELPRHALGRGLESKLAGGGDVPVSARVTGGGPEKIIDETPAVDPPAVAPKPAPAKPKTEEVDEVTRKLEEKIRLEEEFERKKKIEQEKLELDKAKSP